MIHLVNSKTVQVVMETLKEREDLYKDQPIQYLTDEDLISVMWMKMVRVKVGRDFDKRKDDLIDLLAYGLCLLDRWCEWCD